MFDCTPLYVPSNLGEIDLYISISPGRGDHMRTPYELQPVGKHGKFEGYYCFIMANDVKAAQQAVIKLSRELEKDCGRPIQSDRLYLLPLFAKVRYGISVNQKKQHMRPVIRVAHYPEDPVRTWNCEIYASNLVQLQEALFSHERNLLKKRLQVLDQQKAKT